MNKIELLHCDCMEYMREQPDKAFDLAIVDPPYGIGDKLLLGGNTGVVKFHEQYAENQWDDNPPNIEYFQELQRISENQIIWGANYFLDFLPASRGIICWDKNLGQPNNFSHWEMAWTSFDCIAKKFTSNSNTGNRIHPTQKPIRLYNWLLTNYAKPGQRILDTHLGSGSSAIAAHYFGVDFVGCEIDEHYFNLAKQRIDQETRQIAMF